MFVLKVHEDREDYHQLAWNEHRKTSQVEAVASPNYHIVNKYFNIISYFKLEI